MMQVQTQVAGMPMTLVLFSNGCVSLVVTGPCPVIIEQGSPVNASFFRDEFVIEGDGLETEELSYRVAYLLEDYPAFKKWLIQQQLSSPF